MARDDRLYALMQILRDGRLHRAADLGDRLGVSTRTVWRDMALLAATGLPIEGERGVGYILRGPITLPPLILTPGEIAALHHGLTLVAQDADASLARSARSLAGKIATVLPPPAEAGPQDIFVFDGNAGARVTSHLPLLRRAIAARERLAISYIDLSGLESHRDIRPLALDMTGRIWTLTAFCEARGDFRSFRLDRVVAVQDTGEAFPREPGRELADFRTRQAAETTSAPAIAPPLPETRNSDPAGS